MRFFCSFLLLFNRYNPGVLSPWEVITFALSTSSFLGYCTNPRFATERLVTIRPTVPEKKKEKKKETQ